MLAQIGGYECECLTRSSEVNLLCVLSPYLSLFPFTSLFSLSLSRLSFFRAFPVSPCSLCLPVIFSFSVVLSASLSFSWCCYLFSCSLSPLPSIVDEPVLPYCYPWTPRPPTDPSNHALWPPALPPSSLGHFYFQLFFLLPIYPPPHPPPTHTPYHKSILSLPFKDLWPIPPLYRHIPTYIPTYSKPAHNSVLQRFSVIYFIIPKQLTCVMCLSLSLCMNPTLSFQKIKNGVAMHFHLMHLQTLWHDLLWLGRGLV